MIIEKKAKNSRGFGSLKYGAVFKFTNDDRLCMKIDSDYLGGTAVYLDNGTLVKDIGSYTRVEFIEDARLVYGD